jgi:hypothetical protein
MKRTKLRSVSRKQAAINRSFALLKKSYLQAHPVCQFEYNDVDGFGEPATYECNKPAVDVHHLAGRGKNTLDVSTFLAVCREHHDEIHNNPRAAKENGYLRTGRQEVQGPRPRKSPADGAGVRAREYR